MKVSHFVSKTKTHATDNSKVQAIAILDKSSLVSDFPAVCVEMPKCQVSHQNRKTKKIQK